MALEHVKRWKIGEVEVIRIVELFDFKDDVWVLLKDATPDHRITDEVSLVPTPGHTQGHVSIHISSGGQEAVITGDVVHHPVQLAEPDWTNNFDMDDLAGRATRRALFERYADTQVKVIANHFFDPTSGRILKDGDAWKFEADEV